MACRFEFHVHVPVSLILVVALSGCPGAAADDGEAGETDDETGETGEVDVAACIDPGTELLPDADLRAVGIPGPSAMFTCTSGWGTDAPRREPSFTVQLGDPVDFFLSPPDIEAHPDGGVVLAGEESFARYDDDGSQLWSQAPIIAGAQHYLTVEADGNIVVGVYDWNVGGTMVVRFDPDGGELGEVPVPWISLQPGIWGLETLGTDLVIAGFDEDSNGFYEDTLMRLSAANELLLRKSTSNSGGQVLAVSGDGTAMFGSFPGFLVSLDNGAVLGTLTPSMGFSNRVQGLSAGFAAGGGANGDLSVSRYASAGSEQWIQTYDRAGLNDQGSDIAVGPDGTLVVSGVTQVLQPTNAYWYFTQPMVMAVDGDGNALWTDRIAVHGEASRVAVGASTVFVVGQAETETEPGQEPNLVSWLRGYAL